jgi:hypothetical protein
LFQLLLVTGINRTLGISDKWFSVGDSLVLSVLAQVCFHNSYISLNLCGHAIFISGLMFRITLLEELWNLTENVFKWCMFS